MIYNLTPGEKRVMRKALMRSVKVVSEGKAMTEPSNTPRTNPLAGIAAQAVNASIRPDDDDGVLTLGGERALVSELVNVIEAGNVIVDRADRLERELAEAKHGLSEGSDMADVGRAFMAMLPKDYCWGQCPTEFMTRLADERDEAQAIADISVMELVRANTVRRPDGWLDAMGEDLEPDLTYAIGRCLVERAENGYLRFTEFAWQRGYEEG